MKQLQFPFMSEVEVIGIDPEITILRKLNKLLSISLIISWVLFLILFLEVTTV